MAWILRSNLTSALHLAIDEMEEREKKMGYTAPSPFLHTLKEFLEAVERGEWVEVK